MTMMVHSRTPKAELLCMLALWLARDFVRVHTFTGLVFLTAKVLTKKVLELDTISSDSKHAIDSIP